MPTIWDEADTVLAQPPASAPKSVWDEADQVLAQPPATSRPPSIWDEADRVLSTPPVVTPATMPRTQAYHDERAAALRAGETSALQRATPPAVARGFTDPASVRVGPPAVPFTPEAIRPMPAHAPVGVTPAPSDITLPPAPMPTRPVPISTTVAQATAPLEPPPLTIARTPAEATANLTPAAVPMARGPVAPQDPVTAFVTDMRQGVADAYSGAIEFAKEIGPAGFGGKGSVVQPGQPTPAENFDQQMAPLMAAARQALSATSPADVQAAAWETVKRAAALPLDAVGIPVSQIRAELTAGRPGRAAGLAVGTAAVMGGFSAVHEAPGAGLEREQPAVPPAAPAAARPRGEVPIIPEVPHAVDTRLEPVGDLVEHPGAADARLPPAAAEAGHRDRVGERPPAPVVGPDAAAPPVDAFTRDLDAVRAEAERAPVAETPPAPVSVWDEADRLLATPPSRALSAGEEPTTAASRPPLSDVRRQALEVELEAERAKGIPDNPVAQQLEAERQAIGGRAPVEPSRVAPSASAAADTQRPVVTIREKVYRDQDGFSVSWDDPNKVGRQSIFVADRARAEATRDAVRRGVSGSELDDVAFGRAPVASRAEPAAGSEEPLARRADASGALVPSPASRALSLLPVGEKQLRPSEIVRDLSTSLDELPVRVGYQGRNNLGIYKTKAQTIRLKVANDLDTLAHELGHHIHETVIGAEVPPKQYGPELLKLGAPTSRPSYTLKQKLQEGQAEFTRIYLSDPTAAQTSAPKYYAAFEAGLAKHPELAAIVARAQRQYTGHLSLDPVERLKSRIDFTGVDPHPKADLVTAMQTAWVDDLYPLRRMVDDLRENRPIDTTANGYALARLARGATAKADGFLRHGVRDADGTFIAGALEPALKPIRKRMQDFAAYLVASRIPELRARGMETAATLAEAQETIQRFQSPEFDAARQAVYDYQDGLLEYAKRNSALSADQIAEMKKLNQAYVPFQRVIDDVGGALSGGGKRSTPVKRIKGSGRDIINPLESIVKNTHTLASMVEDNRARLALVDQAVKTTGGGRYLERIPEKQVATQFNLDRLAGEIKDELDQAGVDYPQNLDFDRVVKVFTPTQFRMGERGVMSVIRDGKREWYQVNDQPLYDALETMVPKTQDLVQRILMTPARWLRAGATTTIGFIARNPLRDTWEASVNSRYGFRLGYDTLKGLFEFAKKGDDYQHFLNSGAGNSALVGMDRNRLRQELARMGLAERRKFVDSVVLNPINLLQALSEAMEHATRIGEFKRGLDVEGRTAEGSARAALAARDVTIDFARGGTSSKTINRYTAFFNAGVQGNVRLAEVFKRDPVGATTRAAAAIMIPSIALWVVNRNDPEFDELPDWQKNTYWHIPLGHGAGHAWARVPKPFTLGMVFGNSTEAALSYIAKKDPAALDRILPDKGTASRQFISTLPTAIMPAIENYVNYDTFRDRAIVNPTDLGLDTALQYNRWTSELAKYVGPKVGLAPAKLDHLIYGYGAGLASGAVQGVDSIAAKLGLVPKKPAGGPGQLPLVGTFYRDTVGADANSLEEFYRLRDRLAGAKGSITRYEKSGQTEQAAARQQTALKDFGPNAAAIDQRVRAADQLLKEAREAVNQVFAQPALDPDEKKELLDRLYEQMIDHARAGLGKPPLPSRFQKPLAPELLQKADQPLPAKAAK